MDPNNTHEVIFWDNLYKLRPSLLNEYILLNVQLITAVGDFALFCLFIGVSKFQN